MVSLCQYCVFPSLEILRERGRGGSQEKWNFQMVVQEEVQTTKPSMGGGGSRGYGYFLKQCTIDPVQKWRTF